MPHKVKVDPEEKVRVVQDCLSGKKSHSQAGKETGVDESTVRLWINRYLAEGEAAFLPADRNRVYSPELKQHAVEDYLSGKGSLLEIVKKYNLRSNSQLRTWIKLYNSGMDFKMSGGSRMKTHRTTQEERLEIARACIESGRNYGEIATRYKVSYQQVYTWTKKYEELGEAGLEDRRGKRIIDQEPRTEEEVLRQRIAELERKNYILEVENELLKKLEELERGQRYRK